MNYIKNIGSKPISFPSTERTQEQKPAPTPQQEPAAQALTSQGKAAKTSESRITGEVMRQNLEKALASASSTEAQNDWGENSPIFFQAVVNNES